MRKLLFLIFELICVQFIAAQRNIDVSSIIFDTIATKPLNPYTGQLILNDTFDYELYDGLNWNPIFESEIIYTNGIFKSGNTVEFGGIITKNTSIGLQGKSLLFSGGDGFNPPNQGKVRFMGGDRSDNPTFKTDAYKILFYVFLPCYNCNFDTSAFTLGSPPIITPD